MEARKPGLYTEPGAKIQDKNQLHVEFDRLNREKRLMENTHSEIFQLLKVMHIQTTKQNVHGWFPEDPNMTKFRGRLNILAAYKFWVNNNEFPGALRPGNRRDMPLFNPELQSLLTAVKKCNTSYNNGLDPSVRSHTGIAVIV